jgi:hypothetical protein
MPYRSTLLRRLPPLLLCLGFGALAQAQTAVPQNLEQADAQREQAKQMKADADKRYESEQAACYKKFLVNDCLADAKKRHTESLIAARKLDQPAREFQREEKRKEAAAQDAQRAAEAPQREAEQREQGEQYRSEQAAKAAEREKHAAEKEAQAAENRKKLAAEKAKRDAKNAERAKKNAEIAEKNAQKAANDAAKPAPASP